MSIMLQPGRDRNKLMTQLRQHYFIWFVLWGLNQTVKNSPLFSSKFDSHYNYTPNCHHLHLSSSLCPSVWVAVGPVLWWIPIVRRSICEPYLILLIWLQNKKKKGNKKSRKERRVEKHERRFLFLSGELTDRGQMNWKTWIMSWLSPSIPFSAKSWTEMKQNSHFCWNLQWGTWVTACHRHCCYCVCV